MAYRPEFLEALGFERPDGGWLTKSLLHPKLGFGVEVVSGALMDGLADRKRIRVIEIGEANELSVIPIEDLIADRMAAQAMAGRNIREDMKNQQSGCTNLRDRWIKTT